MNKGSVHQGSLQRVEEHAQALGTPLLPLSGVIVHVFSCLTISTPFTTIGVRVILHVWVNVPAPLRFDRTSEVSDAYKERSRCPHVVILSVVVTVTGDLRLESCLGNTVDVCE